MNTKNRLTAVFYLFLIAVLFSCSSEADITKPEIILQNFNKPPKQDVICGFADDNVIAVTGGDKLKFEAIFSDNEALSQYKIDLHNNFDCHGHGSGATPGISLPPTGGDTEDWTLLIVKDISGKEVIENFEITVPENVTAGVYHFIIQLIDESGNDASTTSIYSLKVENPTDKIVPELIVKSPPNKSFTVQKGEVITFEGTVNDDRNLGTGGNGMVFLSYLNKTSGNVFSTNTYKVFTDADGKSTTFNISYTIPNTLVAGKYTYSLVAFDGVRNVSEVITFDVTVQ
jgi:hypothetical protein